MELIKGTIGGLLAITAAFFLIVYIFATVVVNINVKNGDVVVNGGHCYNGYIYNSRTNNCSKPSVFIFD